MKTKLNQRQLDPTVVAAIDRSRRREPKACEVCGEKAIYMARKGRRWIGGCFNHKPKMKNYSHGMDAAEKYGLPE